MLRITSLFPCALLICGLLNVPSMAQDGTLDPSFGSGGRVIITIGDFDDAAYGIAVQPDGRIVLAGHTYLNAQYRMFVARLLSNGALDSTFGVRGISAVPLGDGDAKGRGLVLLPYGDIIVAGVTSREGNEIFSVARFRGTDGVLDSTFGDDGIVQVPMGNAWSAASSVAAHGADGIVAAGYASVGADNSMAVVRLLTDGTIDSTFGVDGRSLVQFSPGRDNANAIAVDPDGNIIACGTSTPNGSGSSDVALFRLTPGGLLDGSFGTDGRHRHASVGNFNEWGWGLTLQSDGKPVVVGRVSSTFHDILVNRYTTIGGLDASFGGSGVVTTDIGEGTDYGEAGSVAIQTDKKIVVTGFRSQGIQTDVVLARYLEHGVVDSTFGNDGIVTTDFQGGDDGARAIAIQQDHAILVAGQSHDGTQNRVAVARYRIPSLASASSVAASLRDDILIAPHPFHGGTTVVFSRDVHNPTVAMMDVLGNSVDFTATVHESRIDLRCPNLSVGPYAIRVTESNGRTTIIPVTIGR
ncbi:MAG: hypothetical protein MUC47_09510 [Candidatus Kapabacteria bacterium]|nr:hypothetical protein [Candidatus Kapabacteria bacterium]